MKNTLYLFFFHFVFVFDSPPKATEQIPPIPTFKCHLCNFEGTHSFALEAHLTFVTNETIPKTTYTCHICNDIFNNSELFKNHMTHELHHFYDSTMSVQTIANVIKWASTTLSLGRQFSWPVRGLARCSVHSTATAL